MRCARRPKALPPCHIHAFIPAHLRSQNLFHRIRASAFTPPHSRRTHAAAFTPHLCSSIDATYAAALTPPHLSCRVDTALSLPHSRRRVCPAALTQPHFCRHIHTSAGLCSACTEPHLCSRSHTPAFTQQHLCCSIHAAAFFRRSNAAALMPSHAAAYYAAEFTPPRARCHFYAAACT